MKKFRILNYVGMILLIAGCSMTAKNTGQLFKYSFPPEGEAIVYHYRLPSIVGNGQQLVLYMNNSFVALIENGGYYRQNLLPGNYKYEIKRQIGNKIFEIKERKNTYTIIVKPNQSYFFRWNVSLAKSEHLEMVKETAGLTEMKDLRSFSSVNFVLFPKERFIVQTPITMSDPGHLIALVPYEPIEIQTFKKRVIGVRKRKSNNAPYLTEIVCNCDLIKDSNLDGLLDEYLIKNKNCRIYTDNGVLTVEKFNKENNSPIVKLTPVEDTQGHSPKNMTSNAFANLYDAISSGNTHQVRELISNGAKVNMPDKDSQTPLFIAAAKGYADIVKQLLDAGANVNLTTEIKRATPLYIACQEGHRDIVKLLIDEGADVDIATNPNEITPIFVASAKGYLDIVKLLINAEADLTIARKADHATPFGVALGEGHTNIAKLLMAANSDFNVNVTDAKGLTLLYKASDDGRNDVVKFLLDAKADANIATKADGYTPIYTATSQNHSDIVELLIAYNADVNMPIKKDGATALHLACQNGNAEIVKMLVDADADVNIPTKTDGATPLYFASLHGHPVVVKLLLNAKADVNAALNTSLKNRGYTSLIKASEKNHIDVVKLLLEAGADVNMSTKPDNHTSLFLASAYGHTTIVKFLLDYNADVKVSGRVEGETDGVTPLHMAVGAGHVDIVALLLEAGANVHAVDTNGKTPLFVAKQIGNKQIIALLKKYHAKK